MYFSKVPELPLYSKSTYVGIAVDYLDFLLFKTFLNSDISGFNYPPVYLIDLSFKSPSF